jgi:hypothetical protein
VITPGGSVLTQSTEVRSRRLLRDGTLLLGQRKLRRGLRHPGDTPIGLGGYDGRGDGLLAVALFGNRQEPIQLWQGRRFERALGSFDVAAFEIVRFSPGGNELAISRSFAGAGLELSIVDVRSGAVTVVPLSDQRGFAWSPDGAWLAVAAGDKIVVYGAVRSDPVYVIPIGASSIAWR